MISYLKSNKRRKNDVRLNETIVDEAHLHGCSPKCMHSRP